MKKNNNRFLVESHLHINSHKEIRDGPMKNIINNVFIKRQSLETINYITRSLSCLFCLYNCFTDSWLYMP
jgi:hypothetical protein